MSRRKVVTEITIETSQVLVIKRKQVTRSRCSECARQAEFVRPDKLNALVDESGQQQGVEALSSTRHFIDAADGSHMIYLRSLQGARRFAERLLNCLRRGSKREGETSIVKDQKSKGVDRA